MDHGPRTTDHDTENGEGGNAGADWGGKGEGAEGAHAEDLGEDGRRGNNVTAWGLMAQSTGLLTPSPGFSITWV